MHKNVRHLNPNPNVPKPRNITKKHKLYRPKTTGTNWGAKPIYRYIASALDGVLGEEFPATTPRAATRSRKHDARGGAYKDAEPAARRRTLAERAGL